MAELRLPFSRPQFDSIEQERLHLKQRLAASFRLFGRFGFSEGVAGHITARDPEHSDRFWVNPFGMSFNLIRVSDLICVNHEGEVVEGEYHVNQAAFAIHSQVHAARPDVVAAAHAHSVHGKAWSSLGRLLDPLTQDSCAFHGDHAAGGAGVGPRGTIDHALEMPLVGGDPHAMMYYVSGVIGLVGIALAWWLHLAGRTEAATSRMDKVARWFGPIPAWAEHKWYVDEFYHAVFRMPLVVVAHLSHWFDKLVIDGLVNLFGLLPRALGGLIRPSQSGALQGYAAGMVGGAAVLLVVVLIVVARMGGAA